MPTMPSWTEQDATDARQCWLDFMQAMKQWETQTWASYLQGRDDAASMPARFAAASEALRPIYEHLLTVRERKTGRLANPSAGAQPAFDTEHEAITGIEPLPRKRCHILTEKRDAGMPDYRTQRRFTLVHTPEGWRLDSLEEHLSGKWTRCTL